MRHNANLDRYLALAFLVALLLLMACAGWQWRGESPVSSSLFELLPADSQHDPLSQRAQKQVEAPLNRDLVALIGAPTSQHAGVLAQQAHDAWAASGLFSRVVLAPALDLPLLRKNLAARRIAMLPPSARQLLQEDPTAFAKARALALTNPFNSAILLPPDQDWLGLGARIEQHLRPESTLTLDPASGLLTLQEQGTTWILLRATSMGDAFDGEAPARVAALVAQTKQHVLAESGQMLVTGGVLYAAHGKAQAVAESQWISVASLIGILLVLAFALRRVRALLVFLPVAVGLLAGMTACIAVFGHIHAVTLVIGTTLIGVVVDFPTHWMGKCYGMTAWRAWPAMRMVLPGLSISLAANLLGYLALGLTPFPALQQTAIFSGAGLLAAYATTVCLLPACCRNWQPRPSPHLRQAAVRMLQAPTWLHAKRRRAWVAVALLLVFAAGGIAKLDLRDDLRLWLNLPAPLLADASRLAKLTGFMPTSQFFLVRGETETEVLKHSAMLSAALDGLIVGGALGGYTSLSDIVSAPDEQHALKQRLQALAAESAPWAPLTQLGIPLQRIQNELLELGALPTLNVAQTLDSPLAERWQANWLAKNGNDKGRSAAIITLSGLHDLAQVRQRTAHLPATLIDRTGEMNKLFAHTRITAAELKLGSYVLAGLLLWLVLGRGASWRILLAPVAATGASLAVLGYLGHPLTLFGLFGLLLVSAIGIDYAVFMYERVAGAAASLVGIFLSASTTVLGFGLLMLSETPVIANFGLSVTIGVTLSMLFAAFVVPARAALLSSDSGTHLRRPP